jgi:hypothetical protein
VNSHQATEQTERRTGGARPALLSAVLTAAAALVLLWAAAGASALVVQLPTRKISYQPVPGRTVTPLAKARGRRNSGKGANPNANSSLLLYHEGGQVMPANTNYALYWAPGGSSEYPAGYQAGIDRYFEDLAHDSGGLLNTDSVLAQYYGPAGHYADYSAHFGGALVDTDPYPANGCSSAPICLTDAQIRVEIRSFVEAHKLPIDLEHAYFLLTPPGVESCTEAAGKSCSAGSSHRVYCAYHDFIEVGAAALIYAHDPYVVGDGCDVGEEHPNGNASDATIAGGLAHEHSEAVTDPKLNAWYDTKGNEVADKCQTANAKTEYGPPLGQTAGGSNYNELIDGDPYLYQQMWSNATGACEQRTEQIPTVTKLSPKSGSPAGGSTVTITGTAFTSPATVQFGSASATDVVVDSSTSITAVAPAGTPKTAVQVTVTTSAGTSAITKKTRFKYKAH